MDWYAWVFDGIGAAVAVPLMGWIITKFTRKRAALTAAAAGQAQPTEASSPVPPPTSEAQLPLDAAPRLPVPGPPRPAGPDAPAGLVDLLLALPGMTDPAFRQRLYERLPRDVAQQLHLDSRAARPELIGLIDTFDQYPHLSPWRSLLDRLEQLLPAHQGVRLLAAELTRRGLV
jgi:Effector-associated domain 2